AQVRMQVGSRVVHFSGDIGRDDDVLMPPPAQLRECDVLVCESTYGNRLHPAVDAGEEIAAVVQRVAARGGIVLIPAFAVGRTQELLLHLYRLRSAGRIPDLPIFVNSPMAQVATEVHKHFTGSHRLSKEECEQIFGIATPVRTTEESKALNERKGPAIII